MIKSVAFKKGCVVLWLFTFLSCIDATPKFDNVAALRCADGIQNFDETGIDCGGNSCNTVCPPYPNEIKGEVLWRTVLTPNKEYTLSGPLLVRDGSVLEINAGTVIKVIPGTNAHIAVLPGAKLWVWGTAQAPVTITSASENPQPGDWGGVMVMGRAPVVQEERPRSKAGNYFYGGTNHNDSSGQLKYLRIEYAGGAFEDGKYYNGLGLYGVGAYTNLDYVQVRHSLGTAMGVYGGTANPHHIWLDQNKGRGVSISESWNGIGKDWYVAKSGSFGLSFEDPLIPVADQPSFSITNLVVKKTDMAAFEFRSVHLRGALSNIVLSEVPRAFYKESTLDLGQLSGGEFNMTALGLDQVSDPFVWYDQSTTAPSFVGLSSPIFSSELPDWTQPFQ